MEGKFKMSIRILVLRAPGTNCDEETARALREVGAHVDVIHTGKLIRREVDIFHYHGLVLPGGFSYGDHVRAGAIWAKKLKARLGDVLLEYVEDERPILGICNGFQVLVELSLLPGWDYESSPQATLAPNISAKFETRWVYLRHENSGKCIFTKNLPKGTILRMPIAHKEGRFLLAHENHLKTLLLKDQIVFRYVKPNGTDANGEYPHNPNGSLYDIAGICNPKGNILGLMPHPERAVYSWQLPDYTSIKHKEEIRYYADGWYIFKSMINYILEEVL